MVWSLGSDKNHRHKASIFVDRNSGTERDTLQLHYSEFKPTVVSVIKYKLLPRGCFDNDVRCQRIHLVHISNLLEYSECSTISIRNLPFHLPKHDFRCLLPVYVIPWQCAKAAAYEVMPQCIKIIYPIYNNIYRNLPIHLHKHDFRCLLPIYITPWQCANAAAYEVMPQ